MNIAILGASGHIAKGLVENFISQTSDQLFVFSRSLESFQNYPFVLPENRVTKLTNDSFAKHKYDAVINCVGVGDPKQVKDLGGQIFTITEEFDRLVLNYLSKNPNCRYINLSSGAVYGKVLNETIAADSELKLAVNNLSEKDYYGIAKLNSEAKHRSLPEFFIVDIRVFSYFSRYINTKAKFLITEILDSISSDKIFVTDSSEITRDFIGPKDLFQMVRLILKSKEELNIVLDAYSKKPITKKQIINYFETNYQLKWRLDQQAQVVNATGSKNNYYSTNKKAGIIGYKPSQSSLDIISAESKYILKK